MKFAKATQKYEAWLSPAPPLIEADLNFKHEACAPAPFPFLRATFYRWAQTWEDVCSAAARRLKVLGVGDLHVENFGTWRDVEGRLVWGINDFDEAWHLPYANDLVRLATSALLAQLTCRSKTGRRRHSQGLCDSLAKGGRPFVLAEQHPVLRTMAVDRLRHPEKYWEKLHSLPEIKEALPGRSHSRDRPDDARTRNALEHAASHRGPGQPGAGALCRHRGVAQRIHRARSQGDRTVGLRLGEQGRRHGAILYQEALDHSVRCHDPFVDC